MEHYASMAFWIIASPYLCILIHETGHLIVALLAGFAVKGIHLGGGPQYRILRWPLAVYVGPLPTGGSTQVSLTSARQLTEAEIQSWVRPFLFVMMAGMATNLIGAIVVVLCGLPLIFAAWNLFFIYFAWSGSDGALIRLLRSGQPFNFREEAAKSMAE